MPTIASRRRFIRLLGSAGIVAGAAPTLAGCDAVPDAATAGWQGPAADAEARRRVLSYALLAPNPHNMQPWLVDLREPDVIVLHVDRARLLPMTDPHGRQVMIGQGTFLEQLDLAASAAGYRADVDYFPDGEPDDIGAAPVARIRLVADSNRPRDPLFDQILRRRSAKLAFADAPLAAEDATALAAPLTDPAVPFAVTRDGDLPATLRDIAIAAWDIESTTPRTHQESVERMRIGADQVARHRDGIDLAGPLFWWGRRLGLITPETMADPTSFAFRSGRDMYHGMFAATPAFGWLTTAGNTRRDQVAAGRAYARLNLQAAALGVALHPVSQVLQEFPEMADLQRRFLAAVGAEGRTVQMLVRLGYADAPAPSPRRPLEDLIVA